MRYWILIILLPFRAFALSLFEAHQLALKHMESIAISEAVVEEIQAEYHRRLGVVFPVLSVKASDLIQDVSANTSSISPVQNTIVRRYTPAVGVGLDYTFFSGLKEYAGIRATKAEIAQREFESTRAGQSLYADVARSFYRVIEREHEIALLVSRQKVLEDRTIELQRFEKIGRSRKSERITVLADRKSLESDLEFSRGELQASRSLLIFLIGVDPLPTLQEGGAELPSIPSREECLQELKRRPDLLALDKEILVKQREVSFFKGDYWPTAKVSSNYYLYRVGVLSDINWDTTFSLNWPFFKGGSDYAAVKEAKISMLETQLKARQIERAAETEIDQQLARMQAWNKRILALREAVALHDENFKQITREYRLGLVTNLEVLTELSDLYESKRASELAWYEAKVAMAELAVSRGKIQETN